MINRLLYLLALVKFLQASPLRWVARLGRLGGGLAFWLDARHRRVAIANLTMAFGAEKSAAAIRALARENFRRIESGEEIPTRENGQPRSVAAITLDINRAFEVAVRRDPANWFWVHNRWQC